MARTGCIAFCLCILLFLAGCGAAQTEETMALTIGTMPSLDKVPMLIAAREGFLKIMALRWRY